MEIEGRNGRKYTKMKKIDLLINERKEIGDEGCWTLSSAK